MSRKITILLLSFIISSSLDYDTTSISELINSAQVIGKVEITAVRKDQFKVKVLDIIKGDIENEIWIVRFKDWTCASRWTEYKVGQKELVFITHSKKSGKWIPIGAGNEGEMPIKNDSVFVLSKNFFRQNKSQTKVVIDGKEQYTYPFSYSDVKSGIAKYVTDKDNISNFSCDDFRNFKSESHFLEGIVLQLTPIKCED